MRLHNLISFTAILGAASITEAQTAETPRWRLVEELRIGAIDGPQAITHVGEIVASPDGRYVYVSQVRETLVRMFDAETGRLIRTIGRSGGGPGEFGILTSVGLKGDSLVLMDARGGRISLFSLTGELLKDISVHSFPISEAGGRSALPRAIAADGTIVGETDYSNVGARAMGHITRTWIVQMDRDGSVLRDLGGRDLSGTAMSIQGSNGMGLVGILPLSENMFFDVAPNGSSFALVDGRITDGRSGRFRVTRMGLNADTIYDRYYRYEPRPVPAELAERILGAFDQAPIPRLREQISIPAVLPPVSAIALNADGSLWIRRGERSPQSVDWLVLNSNGSIHASLTLPIGFRSPHVQGARVWAEVRDELDVSYVIRYRIEAAN